MIVDVIQAGKRDFMNIHWDLKILADTEDQVSEVHQRIVEFLSLDERSHQISEYPKFTSPLFTLTIESVADGRTTQLSTVANLFARIGEPIFVDESNRENYLYYEAMFDSRKHLASIPEIFWARVYAEKRTE